MKSIHKIALIGGTGKSGKFLVKQLIAKNISFKMLIRNPEHLDPDNNAEIVEGTVNDVKAMDQLLKGCDAVISCLGMGIPASEPTIFSTSATTVLDAMKRQGISRYIVITGLNVDTPFDHKSEKVQQATDWMKNTFPASTADKQKEYELLAKSDADWTLVRLPMINISEDTGTTATDLKDCKGEKINATDLANFLIGQLEDKNYIRQAPFLFNV